jgi:hypothetical protein
MVLTHFMSDVQSPWVNVQRLLKRYVFGSKGRRREQLYAQFRADPSIAVDTEAFQAIRGAARKAGDLETLFALAAWSGGGQEQVQYAQRLAKWSYEEGNLEAWRRAIHLREVVGKTIGESGTLSAPCVFIHIPKCGGLSLSKQGDYASIGHRLIEEGEESHYLPWFSMNFPSTMRVSPSTFVFTTVRNIFSWLVSFHRVQLGYVKTLSWLVNKELAERGFDYFVRAIADRSDHWPCGSRSIFMQCYSYPSGTWRVNWINRLESLQEDSDACRLHLGMPRLPVPHVNRSNIAGEDYRRSYTAPLVDLVQATWTSDIERFGFTFDGYEGGVHRLVPHSQ